MERNVNGQRDVLAAAEAAGFSVETLPAQACLAGSGFALERGSALERYRAFHLRRSREEPCRAAPAATGLPSNVH